MYLAVPDVIATAHDGERGNLSFPGGGMQTFATALHGFEEFFEGSRALRCSLGCHT